MKTNKILGSFVAILVALFAINLAVAGTLNVTIQDTSLNDIELGTSSTTVVAGYPSETIPVVVKFLANSDLQDAKLKVWIDGYKNDISASTARFNLVQGSTYIKRLSLTLPNVNDMDNLDEGLTVYVRIADKNNEVESSYKINMQRESYSHEVLAVEAPSKAAAGEVIALDVVLKNIGTYELEDSFVTATIPELGVQRRVYFGDLSSQDNCSNNCDSEDARERRIFMVIPTDVKSGDYTLEVKASNYDSSATVKKVISITGTASKDDTNNEDTNKDKDSKIPTSILVLTVVLVVVFVVLLVVLIVLLTKKPSEKSEDFGETSYY
jgi:preprotein translocase subunit SecG